MIANLLTIFVLALVANLAIAIIDRKLIDTNILNKLKEKQKRIKELKNKSELERELREISELYSKIFPKQMLMMLLNFTIIIGLLYVLKNIYADEIIIPLPFKMPITNKYGIGAIGTYILFSLILSPLIKKLINKIPTFKKWLGGK